MTERKLATIRRVEGTGPIEGADKIEVVYLGGWQCVSQKGLYKVGDLVTYISIDSFVPFSNPAFEWLDKKDGRQAMFNGIVGHRVRTIRLKKTLSQGLLIPLDDLFPYDGMASTYYLVKTNEDGTETRHYLSEGDDVTEHLAIQKYDKPLPAQLAGTVKSTFPGWIRKTDQERFQNLMPDIQKEITIGSEFEITQKLDGSSMTVYFRDGEVGVCSRNLDLKETEGNALWDTARSTGIIDDLVKIGLNVALQGELVGPGINGNKEGLTEVNFYLFDIFDINAGRYFSDREKDAFLDTMSSYNLNWKHAPIVFTNMSIRDVLFFCEDFNDRRQVAEALLKLSEGLNLAKTGPREGIVFKRVDGQFSFKVINNVFLEKHGE